MQLIISTFRAIVGFALFFMFLAMLPLMTAFIAMIVAPVVYLALSGGPIELLLLSVFGVVGFVATVHVTHGLSALQDWFYSL